jgi:peptidoglycan-associated lipoprotein
MKGLLPLCAATVLLLSYGCASKPVSTPLSERIPKVRAAEQKPSGLASESEKRKEGALKEGAIIEEDLMKSDEEKRRKAAEEAKRGGEALKAGRFQDIYFAFDSYGVRSEDIPVLKGIAAWLENNPAVKLMIEGHCDERGTTDYNLALGQKRAEAVKSYLAKLGVNEARIKTVSFGKENPIDPGHSEDAWSRNRRAHFTAQ